MPDQLQTRRELYFQLSSVLAQMDNDQLRARFAEGEVDPGWGRNHTIKVGEAKVFVKRIPVTDREYAKASSYRGLASILVRFTENWRTTKEVESCRNVVWPRAANSGSWGIFY